MENTTVDTGTEACEDESDNFSDIDDLEVHNHNFEFPYFLFLVFVIPY